MRSRLLPEAEGHSRLLVDSNLLVLYVIGSVNIARVAQFKRTSKYIPADYSLLTAIMREFAEIYAVPQVMTEVSNLTDLHGVEKAAARETLKRLIHSVVEPEVSSVTASVNLLFRELGLTDAAIAEIALAHDCTVLTDDLPLYLWLTTMKISAINFTHVRERLGIF